MKNMSVSIAILLLMGCHESGPEAMPVSKQLVGNWKNVNPNTDGITAIDVFEEHIIVYCAAGDGIASAQFPIQDTYRVQQCLDNLRFATDDAQGIIAVGPDVVGNHEIYTLYHNGDQMIAALWHKSQYAESSYVDVEAFKR